jgi:hypothetical protein
MPGVSIPLKGIGIALKPFLTRKYRTGAVNAPCRADLPSLTYIGGDASLSRDGDAGTLTRKVLKTVDFRRIARIRL